MKWRVPKGNMPPGTGLMALAGNLEQGFSWTRNSHYSNVDKHGLFQIGCIAGV